MAEVTNAAGIGAFDDQYDDRPISLTPQRNKLKQPSIGSLNQRTTTNTPSTMASTTFYSRPYRSEDEADDEKKEDSSEPPSLRISKSETLPHERSIPLSSINTSKTSKKKSNNTTSESSKGNNHNNKRSNNHTTLRNNDEDESQPPSLRTNSHEYKDPFFESPQIRSARSNASAASTESSAAAELGHLGATNRQNAASSQDPNIGGNDTETLLKIHIRSSIYGTTAFYLPVSLLVAREKEMKQAAQSFGITAERWTASLLYRTYQQRHNKYQYSAISFASETSEWRTIELDPETECAQSNFSHSLTWEPWLTACIRAYYNTGSIRIPDECIGSDILLALEYFGIVYAPDQLVFDSFGAYLRVKLWSDYFTHRATLADWVLQRMLTRSIGRRSHALCTCPNQQEKRSIFRLMGPQHHQEKRLEVFDGGLTLDPVKYDNTPSCAVVHDFFTDTTSSTETASSPGVQLDAMMREDFRAYLQTSLPGTQITFDMDQIQVTNPATGHSELRHRAVLHIDVLSPAPKAMSPTSGQLNLPGTGIDAAANADAVATQTASATAPVLATDEEARNPDYHHDESSGDEQPHATNVDDAIVSPIPLRANRDANQGPALTLAPSKDTSGSVDDEVAQLTLPKSNSMFAQSNSREDFGRKDDPPPGSLSLPNPQSYDEKTLRKQKQQKTPSQLFLRRANPKQEPVVLDKVTQQDELVERRVPTHELARRVGAGVELRPTPSVDHIYIELGTDTHPRRQQPSRLPPRSPRNSPSPRRNSPSNAWNDSHGHGKTHSTGHAGPTPVAVAAASAAAAEVGPTHSRRKVHARKANEHPRYATDTEESLLHMSDMETDPNVPVGVVVAARCDTESVASTLSGPLTVDEWPTVRHARSFATPVDTLSVADNDRVSVQNRQSQDQRPVTNGAKAHLAELQQLTPAEQEDFYRWQQRQLQRRRLQQQQERQQESGQHKHEATPTSTPDRSSSLFTQQSMSACQNIVWLDYLCEAMGVPGSEENQNDRSNRWRRPKSSTPTRDWHQPLQVTPATSEDDTSSPPVIIPQIRRSSEYLLETDPSPSTAWISDALNYVRSVFEGESSITTVPHNNRPRNASDDRVVRARSPTLVVDRLERNAQHSRPRGTRRQSLVKADSNSGTNDWDDRETSDSDKYRALLNDTAVGNQVKKRVSFDQQDSLPVVVKAKSWSQPFHIVSAQEPSRALSPRNPRSIPIRERPPIDKKALSKGMIPNQRPQSVPRSAGRKIPSQPLKPATVEDKGDKKRGTVLKGLFGFRRKKNVATD